MNSRARTLSFELLKVFSKYSEAEVDEALELLASGAMLEKPVKVSKTLVRSSRNARLANVRVDEGVNEFFNSLKSGDLPDREEIIDFGRGILASRYLRSGRSLREYCSTLLVDLPKKLPPRIFVAKKIFRKLVELDVQKRGASISHGKRMDEESSSSLRAWSDLIVR